MASKRNPAIDVIKGGLMILVMLGHLSSRGVDYDPFKWSLYSFHMPMFMALSGYMMSVERMREGGLWPLVQRYWWRMILPWAVVFVVALPIYFNWDVVRALVHPWNHLWFIPVLFAFIVIAVAVPLDRKWLLLISLVGVPFWFSPQLFAKGWNVTPFDVRYLVDAPFFFFGLWLRKSGWKIGWWIVPVFLLGLGLWSQTFMKPHSPLIAAYPLVSMGSIMLLPWLEKLPLKGRLLEIIGADSLFFYLHHPWLFNIARHTIYVRVPNQLLAFAITMVLTTAILLAAREVIRRWRWPSLICGVVPAEG